MNEKVTDTTAQAVSSGVTIIVPVCGRQEALYETLMSVVFQSIDETRVVVVLKDTDAATKATAEEFQKTFPGGVFVLQGQNYPSQGAMLKAAVSAAQTKYITFVLPGDFVSGTMCAETMSEAEKAGCEALVLTVDNCGTENRDLIRKRPIRSVLPQDYVRTVPSEIFGVLFLRDSFLRGVESALEPQQDGNIMVLLMSTFQKISASMRGNVYFHTLQPKGTSILTEDEQKARLVADKKLLDQIGPENRVTCIERLLNRDLEEIGAGSPYFDALVGQCKDLFAQLSEEEKKRARIKNTKRLRMICNLPDSAVIPKTIYINGFMRSELRDFEEYRKNASAAVKNNNGVVVLDEDSCDISTIPQWLQKADAQTKGIYCALQRIKEKGGVYIGPAVQPVTGFNRELYRNAFFAAAPGNRVLLELFGATAQAPAIQNICRIIEKEQPTEGDKLQQAISVALIQSTGVHLTGDKELTPNGVHLISIERLTAANGMKGNECLLNYSNLVSLPATSVTMPLDMMLFSVRAQETDCNGNLSEKCALLQEELDSIKRGKAWRYTRPLVRLRDKFRILMGKIKKLLGR